MSKAYSFPSFSIPKFDLTAKAEFTHVDLGYITEWQAEWKEYGEEVMSEWKITYLPGTVGQPVNNLSGTQVTNVPALANADGWVEGSSVNHYQDGIFSGSLIFPSVTTPPNIVGSDGTTWIIPEGYFSLGSQSNPNHPVDMSRDVLLSKLRSFVQEAAPGAELVYARYLLMSGEFLVAVKYQGVFLEDLQILEDGLKRNEINPQFGYSAAVSGFQAQIRNRLQEIAKLQLGVEEEELWPLERIV